MKCMGESGSAGMLLAAMALVGTAGAACDTSSATPEELICPLVDCADDAACSLVLKLDERNCPVCDCNTDMCESDDDCAANTSCSLETCYRNCSSDNAACRDLCSGTCAPDDCTCPEAHDPVCGANGINYPDPCDIACAGLPVLHEGLCDPG